MTKNELIKTVSLAVKGDRKAFERLYSEYYDKLYFFVLKNVGRKAAAEDITQETFLQSMEKLSTLEKPEQYVTWLHSIAYHKCADLFRNESRSAWFDTDEEMERAMENVSLNEPIMVPEDMADNKELMHRLRKTIDGLKPDMRAAVILYYYDDMTVAQVAGSLGISENAAKQKLFQARKKLRAQMEKLFGDSPALCAVPMGAVLRGSVTPKYAASVRAAGAPSVWSGMLTGKIVGIAAAAAVAVGIPLGLSIMRSGDSTLGDIRPSEESAYTHVSEPDSSDAPLEQTYPDTESAEESAAPEEPEEDSFAETESISEDSSSYADSVPEISPQRQRIEMTVERMLSMDGAELRALSDEQFEIVPAASTQGASFGIKCAAFPEYVFVVNTADLTEGGPETPLQYPAAGELTGWKYTLGDTVTQLDLYDGAYVGDGVTVGMSYNEIEDILGQELYIQATRTSLELAADAVIGGRTWELHFALTDAEKEEVFERLDSANIYENIGGEDVLTEFGRVDISDLDPVCDCAVYTLPPSDSGDVS